MIVISDMPVTAQPSSFSWQSPEVILRTTNSGEPVLSPYWSCTVSYNMLSSHVYEKLMMLLGQRVRITLPHPYTGKQTEFEGYIESIGVRIGHCSVEGVDITISAIVVQ